VAHSGKRFSLHESDNGSFFEELSEFGVVLSSKFQLQHNLQIGNNPCTARAVFMCILFLNKLHNEYLDYSNACACVESFVPETVLE